MPFINKQVIEFYGSLEDKNKDLEAINYSLLEQVKPLIAENKDLKKNNIGLAHINEQLKIEKLMLGVVIDRIGSEFEIPKATLVKIINGVEAEYERSTILLSENKILREISEREKTERTYNDLKNKGYKSKGLEKNLGPKK